MAVIRGRDLTAARSPRRGVPGSPDRLPGELELLGQRIADCRLCPRLVAWREEVAREKTRRFAAEEYWGRPITGFGDPAAGLVIVGLAPAAHGGNRTGRIFTGDRSGDWLFGALHRASFANQPTSVRRGDGLRLEGAWVTAVVRCAPPANRPRPEERDRCVPYLERELSLLGRAHVFLALGGFAWENLARVLTALGDPPRVRTRFRHGAEVETVRGRFLLGSYHPSQQNTFTGRLTAPMLDAVFARAKDLLVSHS